MSNVVVNVHYLYLVILRPLIQCSCSSGSEYLMETSRVTEVAVIGGGPVGSLTACMFARRGYKVNLYEYREDIRKAPVSRGRTINLSVSERGKRALSSVGLDDEVLKIGIPLKGRMVHLADGSQKGFPYDSQNNQCIYTVERKQLNELLLNETEKYANVSLYFKHKLVDASLESGILTFLKTDANTKVEVHSTLTVGADGAFSAVRRCMLEYAHFNYEQRYIQHGYVELAVPSTKDGNFAICPGFLHLWPRGQYVMVAMPNRDKSWTVTLFLPFTTFDELDSPKKVLTFFKQNFEDAVPLIGKGRIIEDFFKTKPSPLISVKCRPYHVSDRAVIIGDAAHAMVPFYGQGMNAGFEDCLLLDELLMKLPVGNALEVYTDMRWNDAHAICDLALHHFSEISSLVTKPSWKLRRYIDKILNQLLGDYWQILYRSVCFTAKPYAECRKQQEFQEQIIKMFMLCIFTTFIIMILYWTMKGS